MSTPPFIQPGILDRLKAGSFVPHRRAKPGAIPIRDRRNMLSPLAVTKRCIRYDPLVFDYRQDLILQLVDDLNHARTKLIMIGGEQGTGKTSLLRGVIELMGGGQEQVLWFDASRYTDFEEVIQFLIQYIIYVATNLETQRQQSQSPFAKPVDLSQGLQGDPFKQLETLIQAMAQVPLLIVLDNMEYLVDSSLRLNSYPFKELLNFLLKFANIKIVMIGERLPFADMNAVQQSAGSRFIDEIKLQGLSELSTVTMLEKRSRETLGPDEWKQVYRMTSGYPWLLKTLLYLHQKSGVSFDTLLDTLMQPDAAEVITPIEAIARLIYQDLDDIRKKAVQIMILLRHAIDMKTLAVILTQVYPEIALPVATAGLKELEHSLIRPVLKINYPPQEVLAYLRQDAANSTVHLREPDPADKRAFQPWFDLYVHFKKVVYRQVPEFERIRMHQALYEFYTAEKNRAAPERLSRIKPKALIAEASFHLQMTTQRRRTGSAGVVIQNSAYEQEQQQQQRQQRQQQSSSFLETAPGAEPTEIISISGAPPNSASSVIARAYVASQQAPATSGFSLDDYKKIKIPGLDTDAVPAYATDDADARWASLLTEEEKEILALDLQRDADGDSPDQHPPDQHPNDAITNAALSETLEHQKLTSMTQDASETADAADPQLKLIQERLLMALSSRNKLALFQQLLVLTDYRIQKKQFAQAEESLQKAFQLAKDEPAISSALLAEAWQWRGVLSQKTYHYQNAVGYYQQAYRLLSEHGQSQLQSKSHPDPLRRLGRIAQALAELAAFHKLTQEALNWLLTAISHYQTLLLESEDKQPVQALLAECYFQSAMFYEQLEQPEEALNAYDTSFKLDRALGHAESCAAALTNMAQLYADDGQDEAAIDLLKEALGFDRQAENVEGQVKTLEELAFLYEEQFDSDGNNTHLQQAEQALQQALALLIRETSPHQLLTPMALENPTVLKANLYLRLGNLYVIRQSWDNALQHYQWARQTALPELSVSSLAYLDQKIQEAQAHI